MLSKIKICIAWALAGHGLAMLARDGVTRATHKYSMGQTVKIPLQRPDGSEQTGTIIWRYWINEIAADGQSIEKPVYRVQYGRADEWSCIAESDLEPLTPAAPAQTITTEGSGGSTPADAAGMFDAELKLQEQPKREELERQLKRAELEGQLQRDAGTANGDRHSLSLDPRKDPGSSHSGDAEAETSRVVTSESRVPKLSLIPYVETAHAEGKLRDAFHAAVMNHLTEESDQDYITNGEWVALAERCTPDTDISRSFRVLIGEIFVKAFKKFQGLDR